MKKLVFAAIAAFVMVSVSNIFAVNSAANVSTAIPADTTTIDTVAPSTEQPSQDVEQTTLDTDSTADTAMSLLSDTMSTTIDSTSVAML